MIKIIIALILITTNLAVKRDDLVTNVPVPTLLSRDMATISKLMSMPDISIPVTPPDDSTTSSSSPKMEPTTQTP